MMLTKQRLLFCKEYIIDLNATQAAIRAGYSEKTARTQGSKLLTFIDIQEEIQRLMNKRAQKVEITAENVLNDILEVRDICKRKTVTEDLQGDEYIDKDALNGRLKANEMLGKHLKLFTDKVEHSGKIDIPTINIVSK